jgi:hypothetical protein
MTKNSLLVLALAASLAFLPSCETPWSPEVKQTTLETIDRLEAEGTLSEIEAAAAREAVEDAADGFTWEDGLQLAGQIAGAALLAFLGIEKRRGKPKPMSPVEADTLRQIAQREITHRQGA